MRKCYCCSDTLERWQVAWSGTLGDTSSIGSHLKAISVNMRFHHGNTIVRLFENISLPGVKAKRLLFIP